MISTAERRLPGHSAMGPTGVADQSIARVSPAISPSAGRVALNGLSAASGGPATAQVLVPVMDGASGVARSLVAIANV